MPIVACLLRCCVQYCGEGAPAWAVTLNNTALANTFPEPFAAAFPPLNGSNPTVEQCNTLSWSLYQGMSRSARRWVCVHGELAQPAPIYNHWGTAFRNACLLLPVRISNTILALCQQCVGAVVQWCKGGTRPSRVQLCGCACAVAWVWL